MLDPQAGVADDCEPPSRCWKLHLGPLQERQVPLSSEPSPKPPSSISHRPHPSVERQSVLVNLPSRQFISLDPIVSSQNLQFIEFIVI